MIEHSHRFLGQPRNQQIFELTYLRYTQTYSEQRPELLPLHIEALRQYWQELYCAGYNLDEFQRLDRDYKYYANCVEAKQRSAEAQPDALGDALTRRRMTDCKIGCHHQSER
jgi:hypothetical protein